MKLNTTFLLGSFGALAATFALAQDPDDGATRSGGTVPLRPLIDPSSGDSRVLLPTTAPEDAAQDLDIVSRLTVTDLDAREAAFDEIARRAAQDSTVRRELKDLAADSADPDLAFTARLALREADRLSTWGRVGSGFGGRALQAPNDPFDSMRRQMESIFGSDPFVDEFFTNDPFFSRPFSGRRGTLRLDPFGGAGDPLEELHRRVDEMRRELERGRSADDDRGADSETDAARAFDRRGMRSSSSMSLQTTPDGVRVEITEDDGTGPRTEVYEAKSLEDLLKAHPELEGKVGSRAIR